MLPLGYNSIDSPIMQSEFEIGDIVRLKSDGLLMVVSEINPIIITCMCTDEKGKRTFMDFEVRGGLLEKYINEERK